jgi:hypothetical protein
MTQFIEAFDEFATGFHNSACPSSLDISDFFCSDYKCRCVLGHDAVHFGILFETFCAKLLSPNLGAVGFYATKVRIDKWRRFIKHSRFQNFTFHFVLRKVDTTKNSNF